MSRQNITTSDFIKESSEKHNYFYDYSKSVYVKTSEKLIIICPIHGEFQQRPASHLKGAGCIECGKIKISKSRNKTTEQFIKEAREVHGDEYEYSLVNYIKGDIKVKIICKEHGEYLQTPNAHLSGHKCRKCSRCLTTEGFIKKSKEKHGNYYNYDKTVYDCSKNKLTITCTIHGDFEQGKREHLNGKGCNECGKKSTRDAISFKNEDFINKSNEIHGTTYDYSKVNYINSKEKVTITCKKHGEFLQIPADHMRGIGCSKCGMQSNFKRTEYIERAKGRTCIFYTIRCFNEEEEFYKIGITMKTVSERYATKLKLPYDYEVVTEIHGNAEYVWNLEKEEKAKLKSFNYQPKTKFCGSKTECFTKY